MKIQKITFILCSLVLISSLALAGTYNFYFYDNDKDKNPEQPQNTPVTTTQTPTQTPVAIPTTDSSTSVGQIASPVIKSFFDKFRDNYLSVGMGMESYLPDKYAYTLRVKFLPFLGFEAAIPTNIRTIFSKVLDGSYEGRLNTFLEQRITTGLALNANAGLLKTPELRGMGNPYVGLGARLNFLQGLMSINIGANKSLKDPYKAYHSHSYPYPLKPFYTAGITLNIL